MRSIEDLSRLLQTLYLAAVDPSLWNQFLNELVGALNIPAAGILYQDLEHARHGYSESVGVDPALTADYERYYGKLDPFRPRFLAKRQGEVALGDELCPVAELGRSEFHADLLVKYDMTLYGVVATLKQPNLVEHLSLYRRLKGPAPAGDCLEFFRLIVPHLRPALRARQDLCDLKRQACDWQAALHNLSVGIVLLDAQGRSLFVNRAGESILRASDGLRLCGMHLSVSRAAELTRLQALIGAATQTARGRAVAGGGSCMISRRCGGPLRLSIQPLPPSSTWNEAGPPRAVVMVLIRAADALAPPPVGLLRTYYGLTPAEARIALQLHSGHSLASTARLNDVSIGTVRMQLKAVFRKTGVRRQVELQRMLYALSGQ